MKDEVKQEVEHQYNEQIHAQGEGKLKNNQAALDGMRGEIGNCCPGVFRTSPEVMAAA